MELTKEQAQEFQKMIENLKVYHLEYSENYGDPISTMEEGEGFGDYTYYRKEELDELLKEVQGEGK